MHRVAVCDDDVEALHQLEGFLKEYRLELEVDTYRDGVELLASERAYEIILLDVDMTGKNGIETAKELRRTDKKVKIIYVTNYSDYTVFAFAVHAFAYLLKPVKKEILYQQLEEAFEYMQNVEREELKFVTEEGILRLREDEIFYFEYIQRKVRIYTNKGIFQMKKRITDVVDALGKSDFFMPHKSFVVNLYAVQQIKGYDIYLTNGSIVPLSQKKSVVFRQALNRYLARTGGKNL